MRNDGTGATLYVWDYRNRLTDVTFKDGSGAVTGSIHYTYDDNNNRISQVVKDASGTVTLTEFYVYDGSNLLLVLDGSGNVKQRYFNGPNENQVLAEETNIVSSGAGDTHWALTDHEGSVRDVIDNSGTVLDHIKYDSFGNILSQSNAADAMRLAYTGQQYDSQTGLYYDHARYYDPSTGRFLSTDPAGFTAGDENLYRYVGNSPVDSTDPTGQSACSASGQGDDKGPMTWDQAMLIAQQSKAELDIANGTASADDLRAYRDELVANGVSLDQANAEIAPMVSEASARINEENAIRQQEIQDQDQWNQTVGIAYGYFWLAPKALVVGTATAIYNEVTDPIGTTESQINALIHPVDTVETTWNAVQQAWQTPEGKGQILGTIALGWATGKIFAGPATASEGVLADASEVAGPIKNASGDLEEAANAARNQPYYNAAADQLAAEPSSLVGSLEDWQNTTSAVDRIAARDAAFEADNAVSTSQATASLDTIPEGMRLARSPWPENDGFLFTESQTLAINQELDRFGPESGRYLAPRGTPIPQRSLRPGTELGDYYAYRVAKPFDVLAGPATPWFGQPGLGPQFKTSPPISSLLKSGHLERIAP